MSCVLYKENNCPISKKSSCKVIDNNCVLILPKRNLVNNIDNEVYYYGRMADEIIRYKRINSFIFKPQSYLSFGTIKYNLTNNEIGRAHV